MWWPGIDSDIERTVNSCDMCRRSRHKPTEAPLQPWSFPDRPWSRVHIDYAGPVMGKMILVVIYAPSKWIEAYTTSGSTSAITISKLKWIFSSHGIPDVIVSDNATGFVSEEFQSVCRRNGIKQVTSAPHHPATNGLAERAVDILKGGVQRLQGDLETRIAHFLLDYRITPHTTTGVSPAELLTGRKLRTRLDRIIPDVSGRAISKQTTQKERHDQHTQARQYQPGDLATKLTGLQALLSHRRVQYHTPYVLKTARSPDATSTSYKVDCRAVKWFVSFPFTWRSRDRERSSRSRPRRRTGHRLRRRTGHRLRQRRRRRRRIGQLSQSTAHRPSRSLNYVVQHESDSNRNVSTCNNMYNANL